MMVSIMDSLKQQGSTVTCVSLVLALAKKIEANDGALTIEGETADAISLLALETAESIGRPEQDA